MIVDKKDANRWYSAAARRKKRKKASWPGSYRSTEERIKEALGMPKGAHWVLREGGMDGPHDGSIPDWCSGVGGLRGEMGIWHPWQYLGDGCVIWRRLIYPEREPSPVEELADLDRQLRLEDKQAEE